MPKSKFKIECYDCNKRYSASVIMRHVRHEHPELLKQIELLKSEFIDKNINVLCICGEKLYKNFTKLENHLVFKYFNVECVKTCYPRSYCSSTCFHKFHEPWNKGLTKEKDERMKLISEQRKGKNNPIHKILSDPKKYKNWLDNIKKSNENKIHHFKGKTWEQMYGKELADKRKKEHADRLRENRIHLGHKHSAETKQLLRKYTAKLIATGRINKISKVERYLFETLKKEINNIESQYLFGYYTIDIALPKLKIAIEVDGDFWHVNEEQGFTLKYASQKRTKINEKRKNSYLLNKNWSIIRVWESDINNNIEKVLKRIKDHICQKQNLLSKSHQSDMKKPMI